MTTGRQNNYLDCEEEEAVKGTFVHLPVHSFIHSYVFIGYLLSAKENFSIVVTAVNE